MKCCKCKQSITDLTSDEYSVGMDNIEIVCVECYSPNSIKEISEYITKIDDDDISEYISDMGVDTIYKNLISISTVTRSPIFKQAVKKLYNIDYDELISYDEEYIISCIRDNTINNILSDEL